MFLLLLSEAFSDENKSSDLKFILQINAVLLTTRMTKMTVKFYDKNNPLCSLYMYYFYGKIRERMGCVPGL